MDEELKKSPDRVKAHRCAKGLLQSAGVKAGPIMIATIHQAAKKDFNITIAPAPNGLFNGKGDAVTQRRDDNVYIVYDKEKPDVRKRFSIAHELGHLYLGHLHGNSSIDLGSENFDEIEANVFAAHMLMPKELLKSDVKKGLTPEDLAKKYWVSLDAIWYQLTSVGLINLMHSAAKA